MIVLTCICWDNWYVLECSFSIMTDDYELTMDYDMIVSPGKGCFELMDMIVLICGTCGWHVWAVTGNMLGISVTR